MLPKDTARHSRVALRRQPDRVALCEQLVHYWSLVSLTPSTGRRARPDPNGGPSSLLIMGSIRFWIVPRFGWDRSASGSSLDSDGAFPSPFLYNTNNEKNNNINSPGHGPIGVLDLRQFPWSLCCCFQTAQRGRPRALGGQSRWQVVGLDPHQSPSGPWRPVICEGFFRRNQKTPLKCRDWSRRSTSNFETAFFKKVSNLKTFF